MAVEKYVKKKERQKVAETNKLAREKTSATQRRSDDQRFAHALFAVV